MQGLAVPRAIDLTDQKQQGSARLDQHLRVVARGFQFCRSREECGLEFLCVLDGIAQRGCAQRVEIAARGVHHNQAVFGEEAR